MKENRKRKRKRMPMLYTPGPTEVPPQVLKAMSEPITNPDLDENFFSFYDELCSKLKKVAGTGNDLFVMAGEGMVALDAAVANLVERGDEVLAITSGVFGDGFADMVARYGGKPIEVREEYNSVVSPSEIDRALERNPEIKVATFVHCETPAGTLGSIEEVGRVCNDHDVILISDTVSTLGGMPLNVDSNRVDVCLGASQKCFSAPPGLAIISVSKRAWEKIQRRREKVASFYLDLSEWRDSWLGKRVFPYTQSISDLFAINSALGLILKEGLSSVYKRHEKVARLVRDLSKEIGLELFPISEEICSPTVTALILPHGIKEDELRSRMEKKYSVSIAGSWGKLAGKVVRLGHMGYNAYERKAEIALNAFEKSLKDLGFRKDLSEK
jgi:aspartate aminotransferase-like enzyme